MNRLGSFSFMDDVDLDRRQNSTASIVGTAEQSSSIVVENMITETDITFPQDTVPPSTSTREQPQQERPSHPSIQILKSNLRSLLNAYLLGDIDAIATITPQQIESVIEVVQEYFCDPPLPTPETQTLAHRLSDHLPDDISSRDVSSMICKNWAAVMFCNIRGGGEEAEDDAVKSSEFPGKRCRETSSSVSIPHAVLTAPVLLDCSDGSVVLPPVPSVAIPPPVIPPPPPPPITQLFPDDVTTVTLFNVPFEHNNVTTLVKHLIKFDKVLAVTPLPIQSKAIIRFDTHLGVKNVTSSPNHLFDVPYIQIFPTTEADVVLLNDPQVTTLTPYGIAELQKTKKMLEGELALLGQRRQEAKEEAAAHKAMGSIMMGDSTADDVDKECEQLEAKQKKLAEDQKRLLYQLLSKDKEINAAEMAWKKVKELGATTTSQPPMMTSSVPMMSAPPYQNQQHVYDGGYNDTNQGVQFYQGHHPPPQHHYQHHSYNYPYQQQPYGNQRW